MNSNPSRTSSLSDDELLLDKILSNHHLLQSPSFSRQRSYSSSVSSADDKTPVQNRRAKDDNSIKTLKIQITSHSIPIQISSRAVIHTSPYTAISPYAFSPLTPSKIDLLPFSFKQYQRNKLSIIRSTPTSPKNRSKMIPESVTSVVGSVDLSLTASDDICCTSSTVRKFAKRKKKRSSTEAFLSSDINFMERLKSQFLKINVKKSSPPPMMKKQRSMTPETHLSNRRSGCLRSMTACDTNDIKRKTRPPPILKIRRKRRKKLLFHKKQATPPKKHERHHIQSTPIIPLRPVMNEVFYWNVKKISVSANQNLQTFAACCMLKYISKSIQNYNVMFCNSFPIIEFPWQQFI